MRFQLISLGLMAISALAKPLPSTAKAQPASLEDVATIGFATMNGGTSGGKGGKVVEVASLTDLTTAVKGDVPTIVVITGPITGNRENVRIGSNKSVIGKDASVVLTGFTLTAKLVKNVIIRNLAIQKVVGGDAIALQLSQNIWVDHCDLSSDRLHNKDYYDGLLDITHAVDYVTVTATSFHDHWKCSLVGHSNSNGAEDRGHLTVTYALNAWNNINSRTPSLRFGTGHIFNSYFENVGAGINTRLGAQVLVQNNVFVNSSKALYATDVGYAVATGNDWGGSNNSAPLGNFTTPPYAMPALLDASAVKDAVLGTAGVKLTF